MGKGGGGKKRAFTLDLSNVVLKAHHGPSKRIGREEADTKLVTHLRKFGKIA